MPNSSPATIFHVDMDAFFAAVEQLDDPLLRGKPVIVGGLSSRGVVATCSYEARAFGVGSAMPTRIARRKCPKGIYIKPRMARYKELSRDIFAVFSEAIERIEKVSIDEGYLDATQAAPTPQQAEALARSLKANVRERFGLTASIGVAPCKFVAKIASDLEKPDGLVLVRPEEVVAFLAPLSVAKIPGVGPVTESKLHKIGVRTILQLAQVPRASLQRQFGKFGNRLYDFARGIDPRPIVVERQAKSIGSENTFERDHKDLQPILESLYRHAEDVARRLDRRELSAKTVTLKLRYDDFSLITRSQSLDLAVHDAADLYKVASALLPKTEAGLRPVRLAGLSASSLLSRADAPEMDFFGATFTEND